MTGVREGCDPLALSRGCAFEGFVFDEAGYPFEDVVSDDASVGRSAPLHPLGDGVREGVALSRSPGGWFGARKDFISGNGGLHRKGFLVQ